MKVIGKHTVQIFDRQNKLVDEKVSYNVITTKGRERILDIWAFNLDPSSSTNWKDRYGVELVDTSPTVLADGTRKCSFFNLGTMTNCRDEQSGSRDMNAYDSKINYSGTSVADGIFTIGNTTRALWNQGDANDHDKCDRWHGIDLSIVTTNETVAVNISGGNQVTQLAHGNIKFDYTSTHYFALKVWNAGKTSSYTYGTHYTFNRLTGVITFLQSGGMPTANYVVEYKWHDVSLFDTGLCGMSIYGWPVAQYENTYYTSYFGHGKFSATGGETWEKGSWPWMGKPHDPVFNYRNEDPDWLDANLFMDSYSNTKHEHVWFTYPYVMVKPTNFAFIANFQTSWSYASSYEIQNWNFFKPAPQPQTPRALALGTGDSAADVGNTALGTEALRLDVYATERPSNGLGRWKAYIDYAAGTGITFKEVGLFYGNTWLNDSVTNGWSFMKPIDKVDCNQLFSRTVYDTPWSKTADQRVELTYEVLLT